MKKLLRSALLCAAAFVFLVPANAQTVYVAATKEDGGVIVKSNKANTITLDGREVTGVGANSRGVWTLVRTTDVRGNWYSNVGPADRHMIGWGEYVLYLNGNVYKKYPFGDPKTGCISSAVLKVKGNDVAVAGTMAKKFEDTWCYWGKLWGELNGRSVYNTEWERKSLKRKWFQGLTEPTHGLLNVGYAKTPDVDGNFSSMYHVFACDILDGKIYSTGWGEREYTYYNTGLAQDVYYVRRCARGWLNGKEVLQQYKNQTSGARTLTIGGNSSNPIWYTAGHHRGDPMSWTGNTDMASLDGDGVITAEAVVTYNNSVRRYFIANGNFYMYDGKNIKTIRDHGNFKDVVAYKNQVYVLYTLDSRDVFSVVKVNFETDDIDGFGYNVIPKDGMAKDWKLAVTD